MAEANKTYGFTIAVKELRETVPNIFRYASAYKRNKNLKSKGLWEMFLENPPKEEDKPPEENKQDKLPEEILQNEPGQNTVPEVDPEAMEGESYNMCHFWSNFEIARLDWFRSKEYEEFFDIMDKSGGFWTERVCYHVPLIRISYTNHLSSGVTHPFIRWPPVLFSRPMTFITSEISGTATPPSNIARPMPPHGSCHGSPTWKRQRRMKRSALKKTNTGQVQTRSRRMGWAVGVGVIRTLLMWKANRVAVLQNGLRLLEAGLLPNSLFS